MPDPDAEAPAPLLDPEGLTVAAWRAAVVLALAPWPVVLRAAFHDPDLAVVPLLAGLAGALALAFSVPWVRQREPRGWTLRAFLLAAALSAGPLVALLHTSGPSAALVTLAGVLVGAVVAGVMAVVERAALRTVQRLRARALVALTQGVVAVVGVGAVALQVVFTRDAQAGGSYEAGYGGVATALGAPDGGVVVAGALLAANLAAVAWARLRHPALWRQVVSALLLVCLPLAAAALALVPVNHPRELERHVLPLVGAPALATVAASLALRASEGLEGHLLRVARVVPRPLPPGSRRRLLRGVAVMLLTALLVHVSLSVLMATRLRWLVDDLRARGEPMSPADLGAPPAEADDALRCYVRALERLGPRGPSFETHRWRSDPLQRGSAAAVTSRTLERARLIRIAQEELEAASGALEDVAEGARRPACGVVRASWTVSSALRDLLEARFYMDLVLGRHDAAADVVQLRHALWDRVEPEVALDLRLHSRQEAYRLTGELLARGEPSIDACRRLDRTFADGLPRETLRRGVRGLRLALAEPLWDPVPLAARLGWVRDLDRARALTTVDAVIGALDLAPATPRLATLTATGGPTWFGRARDVGARATGLVASFERAETWRQLVRLALRLRIHRLEHGAYPTTLDALGDVPRQVDGRPVVYQPRTAGFALYLGADPRPALQVDR